MLKIYVYGAIAVAIVLYLGKVYHDGIQHERARIEAQHARDAQTARDIERAAGPCDRDANCVQSDPFRVPDIRSNPGK